jgi:LmbE family N-acetylglucosaminyl deacetylase
MIVLVVVAHPDDEVLGCGGTLSRISAEQEVHIAILGEGSTSRANQRSKADIQQVGLLKDQAQRAAELLGAKSITFEDLPDNRFDELPLLEVVKRVERLLDNLNPSTVYSHHPGDLNIDHQITFRAVLTATRPTGSCTVNDIYSFEVPSSTEWAFQQIQPSFRPNVFFDISQTIETKVAAMEMYSGEARPFPHPRSAQALRAIAQRWGSVAGVGYAEAFELVRSIRT